MTNCNKIREYYDKFNEDERLINDNSGRLEFEMTMRLLEKYLPKEATILDLGGATGAYTFPLAERGYKIYLADLSDTLINIAEQDSKYVPEIMNLLHHKNMEEHRIGTRDYPYHNLNYDYVLLTCLKQKPELITQELYNDIKSQDEKLTEMRNNPYRTEIIHLVGGILPDLSGTGGDEKGRKLIPYMESVNPKLKENWQESQRQQTNLNRGISRGGMGK